MGGLNGDKTHLSMLNCKSMIGRLPTSQNALQHPFEYCYCIKLISREALNNIMTREFEIYYSYYLSFHHGKIQCFHLSRPIRLIARNFILIWGGELFLCLTKSYVIFGIFRQKFIQKCYMILFLTKKVL